MGTDRNLEWPGSYCRVQTEDHNCRTEGRILIMIFYYFRNVTVVAVLKRDRPSCKGGLHPKRIGTDKEKIEGMRVL